MLFGNDGARFAPDAGRARLDLIARQRLSTGEAPSP
jgi:hypothetical protein